MSNGILRLQQGDQFAIPFPIYIGDAMATPDNVTGVRIQINDALEEYPGNIVFDSDLGAWAFPLTEEMTRTWPLKALPAQVGIKLGNDDFRYTPTFMVDLQQNIITDTWGGDGA